MLACRLIEVQGEVFAMRYLRVALPILVLVLVTGTAIAAPSEDRLFQQSPEVRVQEWQTTFLRFIADHPATTLARATDAVAEPITLYIHEWYYYSDATKTLLVGERYRDDCTGY